MLAGWPGVSIDSALEHGFPDDTHCNFYIAHAELAYLHTGRPVNYRLNPYVTVAASAWQSNPGYRA